jgi:mono/diheme cytochrome c family protein
MRSHLLTGALLALVTIVPTITPLTAQPADNSAYGRRLYHDKAQCSFCHGWAADGSGEPQSNGGAANLRQSFLNRDQLVEVTRAAGRERRCPTMMSSLTPTSAATA